MSGMILVGALNNEYGNAITVYRSIWLGMQDAKLRFNDLSLYIIDSLDSTQIKDPSVSCSMS